MLGFLVVTDQFGECGQRYQEISRKAQVFPLIVHVDILQLPGMSDCLELRVRLFGFCKIPNML